jgi:PAS domain S-box-containing protein
MPSIGGGPDGGEDDARVQDETAAGPPTDEGTDAGPPPDDGTDDGTPTAAGTDAAGAPAGSTPGPPSVADRYEALVTAAPDAILVYDYDTNRIVEANEAATELFGYSRKAFQGLFGHELLPPEVEPGTFRERFRRAIAADPGTLSTTASGDQLHLLTADGDRVPVEIRVAAITLDGHRLTQAVVRDRSDQQRIAADLERTERHLWSVLDHLPAVLFAVEPDGTISHIEGTGLERLGIVPAALTGEDLFEVFAEFEEVTATVERALGGESFGRLVTFGGVPFRVWFHPIYAPDGTVDRVVGLALDVTEDRRRSQLLQVLNRVLRHNLRNELNIVLGATAVARDAVQDRSVEAPGGTEEALDALDRVTGATERLLRMSEKARAVGRVESDRGDDGPHDLAATVRAACATVEERFPDAVIDCWLPDADARIAAVGFQEAIEELLDNAVRHNDADQPQVAIAAQLHERPGREIEVTVVDDGPGLSEMEREVLRAGHESPLRHSGGLGLWLVNWVVMTAGGDLEIGSPDSGTTVTVTLPRSDSV